MLWVPIPAASVVHSVLCVLEADYACYTIGKQVRQLSAVLTRGPRVCWKMCLQGPGGRPMLANSLAIRSVRWHRSYEAWNMHPVQVTQQSRSVH